MTHAIKTFDEKDAVTSLLIRTVARRFQLLREIDASSSYTVGRHLKKELRTTSRSAQSLTSALLGMGASSSEILSVIAEGMKPKEECVNSCQLREHLSQ